MTPTERLEQVREALELFLREARRNDISSIDIVNDFISVANKALSHLPALMEAVQPPMNDVETKSGCEVCGYSVVFFGKLCNKCNDQKKQVEEIRRQKKRDAAFGNVWEEAGVKP